MNQKPYDNIIFFSNGSIGDFLMALYLCRCAQTSTGSLIDNHIRYTILVPRGEAFLRTFLDRYPNIKVSRWRSARPWDTVRLLFAFFCRRNIVVTHHSYTRIPRRVKWMAHILAHGCTSQGGSLYGFVDDDSRLNSFYDGLVKFDHTKTYTDNLKLLLERAGLTASEVKPDFFYEPRDTTLADLGLEQGGYVVFNPFAASAGTYPPERYPRIIDAITESDYSVVLTGAFGDRGRLEALRVAARSPDRITVAPGLDAQSLATLIDKAALYLGVDTGTTHLAAFLHKKSVVIGHRASPAWLPTYNEDAVILYNTERCTCRGDKTGECRVVENGTSYYRCLYDISTDDVIAAVTQKLYS